MDTTWALPLLFIFVAVILAALAFITYRLSEQAQEELEINRRISELERGNEKGEAANKKGADTQS